MKIGILTFHRAWNYGAVLQCYALQEALTSLGYDAQVIDYRQPYIEKNYKVFLFKGTVKSILMPKKYRYLGFLHRLRILHNFKSFRNKFLKLTPPCSANNIPTDFDEYVIGSDQLWVPECMANHFDRVYMGSFPREKNSHIISYAISCNKRSIDKLTSQQKEEINHNFSNLSIREFSSARHLENVLNRPVNVDIDPTLLLDKSAWRKLIVNQKVHRRSYILIYYLPGREKCLSKKDFVRKAKKIANLKRLDIVDLSNFSYSVEEFVSLISNAEIVMTTSFHGIVFSLIFNRPLIALQFHDNKDWRYVELLKMVGAENSIYKKNFSLSDFRAIDYDLVNRKLAELREHSLSYLRNAL